MQSPEYTQPTDIFYNYCLWEYTPVVPFENKFRSINLLFHTFELQNIDQKAYDLVRAIQKEIGVFNTVWGVKQYGNCISWEFYFYDYRRLERDRSITRVLEAIKPLMPCELVPNENLLYFMFSIDIDNGFVTREKSLDKINVYIGNPGSDVSSGISFSLSKEGKRLDNFYFFFDPYRHENDILGKLACSAFVDISQIHSDQIYWPELSNCRTICIANKRECDCIYFSGITIDQLLFFLQRMKYPQEMVAYVVEHKSRLDHLLYDVGIDYRMEGDELVHLKSGYYGIF